MPFLQFKGKTAIESYHHSVPHHTLEFDGKLSVLGKGEKPGLDGNLIIEGDNLLALKSLLPTHAGRIKCIYIDPPYNTGNEGWVYNDNLTQPQFKEWIGQAVGKEGEDATRHDKWCCMMYPRLALLKELLRDDGVIFVSIDDIEVHNLRMMMDDVFGAERFLGCFVWKSRQNIDNRNVTGVSIDHEYVICYGSKIRGAERDRSQYANSDNDPRGDWASGNMVGLATKEQRPNLHYDLVNPKTRIKYGCPEKGWRYDPSTMQRLIKENRILWPDEPTGRPRRKVFLDELGTKFTGFSSIVAADVYTRDGSLEIRRIFGDEPFAFPKPSKLVQILIDQATDDESIVLDSFAGTGTSAHAVLNLNAVDGGNRRFILVQQPCETKEQEAEHFNVCRNITRVRVERVIEGYSYVEDGKGQKEVKVAGLGGAFTYARVGNPLFGEYRDFGKKLPAYEELAKYIFYTETSRDFDRKAMNEKTGKIGEHGGTSYYLLYTPNGQEDRQLDLPWLEALQKTDKNRNVVVYCEKIHVHRDDLAKYEQETKRTVRPMVVPFNLK
jgi:adenine-specific DNA-methyltransferase